MMKLLPPSSDAIMLLLQAFRGWRRQALAALVVMSAAFVLMSLELPGFGPAFIERNGTYEPITLPMHMSPPKPASYKFRVSFRSASLGPTYIRVVPDDCVTKLTFDGVPVDLSRIHGTCDYVHGFSVRVPPGGRNQTLEATVRDDGGAAGFELLPVYGLGATLSGIATAVSATWLLIAFAAALGLPVLLRVAAAAGALSRVYYMSHTSWLERTHDAQEHMEYVQMMRTSFAVPSVDACWECYHPPTYFALATLWIRVMQVLRLAPSFALQVLALLFSGVFLLFGLLAIDRMIATLKAQSRAKVSSVLAGFLFALWPSAILHSPRIGNDAPFYALSAVSVALLAYWWNDRRSRYWVGAVLFAGFATLTKSNGVVLAAAIVGVILFAALSEPDPQERRTAWRTFLFSSLTAMAVLALPLGIVFWRAAKVGKSDLVTNIAGTNPKLLLPNAAGYFLQLPLRTWLDQAFADPWHDESGRAYYWNYFGKTALFGEFNLGSDPLRSNLAVFLSALLLVLAILVLRAFLRARRDDGIWAIPVVVWIAGSIAVRARHPYAPMADFRYVLPVLIPLCVGVVRGLEDLKNFKVRLLAGGSVVAFIALSVALCTSLGM